MWTGRVVSALVALFLGFDGVTKVMRVTPVVEANVRLGYPADAVPIIGAILLVATALYVVPRTAVLGAVLLTGCLGGATATHVRAGDPTFAIVFPVVMGALAWAGLYVRRDEVRAAFRPQ
jgi:hypothetical protein